MFTEIRIYYEGDSLLKPGFRDFFRELLDEAAKKRRRLQLIAAQGSPCRDFRIGMQSNPDAWNILLKDSEGPDDGTLSVNLCKHEEWNPSGTSIFWMVEMMEAWFHADKDALREFYGPGFKERALKPNPKVEQIPKRDLKSGLSAATRHTFKGQGDYFKNKTSHGPKLLGMIDPEKVRKAAPNCDMLFRAILEWKVPSRLRRAGGRRRLTPRPPRPA